MKFFKKRDTSGSRRNAKFKAQRLRFAVFAFAGFGVLAGLCFFAFKNGSVENVLSRAKQEALTLTANAGFRVQEILVTGRHYLSQEELLTHLDVQQGSPIFGVSIAAAQDSLRKLPWVEKVSVSRRLPDKIVVHIAERTPAALWQYNKKISLIDAQGAILTSNRLDQWKGLPLVVGEDASAHVVELIGLLHAEPEVAAQLASATRIGQRRWDLRLKNDTLVRLPEKNVELALRRLMQAQQKHDIFSKNISYVDLRAPDKFVIAPEKTEEKS
jgi:cell division protein FtsQ